MEMAVMGEEVEGERDEEGGEVGGRMNRADPTPSE